MLVYNDKIQSFARMPASDRELALQLCEEVVIHQ
jgi:hypothetical protein